MNPSISALMTRLSWQKNEIELHLQAVKNEKEAVLQQLQELEQLINQSGIVSLIINPELEMNKLNYLTQQHQKKNELMMALKNHQALENRLHDKLQRIKTELKMIEKYVYREEQIHTKQRIKTQEHALEEWVIQQRESL